MPLLMRAGTDGCAIAPNLFNFAIALEARDCVFMYVFVCVCVREREREFIANGFWTDFKASYPDVMHLCATR
jgi:hypothetical protein